MRECLYITDFHSLPRMGIILICKMGCLWLVTQSNRGQRAWKQLRVLMSGDNHINSQTEVCQPWLNDLQRTLIVHSVRISTNFSRDEKCVLSEVPNQICSWSIFNGPQHPLKWGKLLKHLANKKHIVMRVFMKFMTNEKSYLGRHKHASQLFSLCDWTLHQTTQSYLNQERTQTSSFSNTYF